MNSYSVSTDWIYIGTKQELWKSSDLHTKFSNKLINSFFSLSLSQKNCNNLIIVRVAEKDKKYNILCSLLLVIVGPIKL